MTMMTATHPAPFHKASIWAGLASLHSVWRQRQALRALDAHALSDIGLTAREAATEARRPIWDAPETWRA